MADSSYAIAGQARSNVLIQPVTLNDATTGILVKSPYCVQYDDAMQCTTTNTQDSPFSVRTITQDGKGSEIAWRGAFANSILGENAIAAVRLQSASSAPVVGLYDSNGLLLPVTVNGKFE